MIRFTGSPLRPLLLLALWTLLVQSVLCQYGSSYGGSYGSTSGSAAYPSYTSNNVVAANNQLVNFPLIQLPVTLGNTNNAGVATVTTGQANVTNFLASLPASPVSTGLYPFLFQNGRGFVDLQRNAFYQVSSDQHVFNRFLTNPLNLSDSTAVGIAAFNGPLVPFLTLGATTVATGTTTVASASTTNAAAGLVNTAGLTANSGVYYAANAGNIAGLGVAGLGLQVPGTAPNVRVVPGASYAYATGNNAANTATNTNSNANYGYGASNNYVSSGSSGSYGGYGRR